MDKLQANMSLSYGIPKKINFPFRTNGKFIILGVPILEHITVGLAKVAGCTDVGVDLID